MSSHAPDFSRAGRRLAAAVAAAGLVLATGGGIAPAQDGDATLPASASPSTPTADPASIPEPTWFNEAARSTDPQQSVELDIAGVEPVLATEAGAPVTYRLRITNNRLRPVTGLALRLHSLPALTTPGAVRTAQVSNIGEYPEQSPIVELPGLSVAPGASATVQVTVRSDGSISDASSAEGVAVSIPMPGVLTPGAHPLLFALSGQLPTPQGGAADAPAELAAVARATLTVLEPRAVVGEAKAGPASGSEDAEATTDATPTAPESAPTTLLWPLAARLDLSPGQTGDAPTEPPLYLQSEQLAQELGEGGRLRTLLDTYRAAADTPGSGVRLRQASCLAIDPELLSTVERMTRPYWVSDSAPLPVEPRGRLRDSWGQILGSWLSGLTGGRSNTVAGTGQADAQRWLTDLRELAANSCTVPLPGGGANPNLLPDQPLWNAVQALGRAPDIFHRTLGVWPRTDLVIPGSGYLDARALPTLGAVHADARTLAELPEPGAAPLAPTPQRPVTVLLADNTLTGLTPLADAAPAPTSPVTAQLPAQPGARALTFPADLGAALRATGTAPQVAPFTDPNFRYDLSTDSPVAAMTAATAVLDRTLADAAPASRPVIVAPPALWTAGPEDAAMLLRALDVEFATGRATPTPLPTLLDRPASAEAELLSTELLADPAAEALRGFGADASALSRPLLTLTSFMANDPRIALTREAFTRPLVLDVLRATSDYELRTPSEYPDSLRNRAERLRGTASTMTAMHRSISLLPPGNVFARTSETSPLLVVARNGLPLPVEARIAYRSSHPDTRVALDLPDATLVPARGSLTVQVTASLPPATEASVAMWLATAAGVPMTPEVEIAVQAVPGLSWLTLGGVALLLIAIAVLGKLAWSRRR